MTLAEALELARDLIGGDLNFPRQAGYDLARYILDTLGESVPCKLLITYDGFVDVGYEALSELTPAEARTWAAMLLRAADEAEAGK